VVVVVAVGAQAELDTGQYFWTRPDPTRPNVSMMVRNRSNYFLPKMTYFDFGNVALFITISIRKTTQTAEFTHWSTRSASISGA